MAQHRGLGDWVGSGPVQLHSSRHFVAKNEAGYRIGEGHQHARLTDADVEAIRDEYEAGVEGRGPRIGYRALAAKWNVGKRTIRDIVNYNRRNQWVAKWERVRTKGET